MYIFLHVSINPVGSPTLYYTDNLTILSLITVCTNITIFFFFLFLSFFPPSSQNFVARTRKFHLSFFLFILAIIKFMAIRDKTRKRFSFPKKFSISFTFFSLSNFFLFLTFHSQQQILKRL